MASATWTARTEPRPVPSALRAVAGTRAAAGRDHAFDNARFVLIALVVVGHGLRVYVDQSRLAYTLYYWIYLFHMPAFVLVAGYFTKRPVVDERRVRGVLALLAPYLIFQLLYREAFALHGDGHLSGPAPLEPEWLMWFILALMIWRMLAPYLARLRQPVLVGLAVSLAAGTLHKPEILAMDRVLALLPFFVLGTRLRRRHLDVLTRPRVRAGAAAILAASLPLSVVLLHGHVPLGWLYWSDSYDGLGVPVLYGMAVRAVLVAVAVALCAAVFALMPARRTVVSGLGAASLYGYLLHGFVVLAFKWSPLPDAVGGTAGVLVSVAAWSGVAALLCSPPVRMLARPVVEPPVAWLLRPCGRIISTSR